MDDGKLDQVRGRVLDQMERGNRIVRAAVASAIALEGMMLVACFLLVDWSDRTQALLFVIFILSYLILILSVIALAAHVSRATARILSALAAQRTDR